ncbi:hypothetical protein CBR_g45931 [Chara braunii]|nr:hypothetical protein CBR_g45931 [Chara braunii]|eukprot:GBG87775.1 hypothetical protein CBR_g45931 [Chara braunii]
MASTATAPSLAGASMLPSPSSPRLASGKVVAAPPITMQWVQRTAQPRAMPDRSTNSFSPCRFAAARSCASSSSSPSSSSSLSSLSRSASCRSHSGEVVHRVILVPAAAAKERKSAPRRRKEARADPLPSFDLTVTALTAGRCRRRYRSDAVGKERASNRCYPPTGCMAPALRAAEDMTAHGRGRRRRWCRPSCRSNNVEGTAGIAKGERRDRVGAKGSRFRLPTAAQRVTKGPGFAQGASIPDDVGQDNAAAAAAAAYCYSKTPYSGFGGVAPPRSRRKVKVINTLIRCAAAISSVDDASSSSPSSPSSSAAAAAAAVSVGTTTSLGEITVKDFPILSQEVNGRRIVYLDNAATSQKPRQVIDAVQRYYQDYNSNVHRGIHTLSVKATEAYEDARGKIAKFINAERDSEIIYTRNATEAINLVANTWGVANLTPGDEVVLSVMEHHSNLVPWQIIAERTGAVLRFVSLSQCESLDMDHLRSLVGNKTKLVALQHVSNALGCVNDAVMIGEIAHKYGAKVLLDGCQSVPHMPVDVQALDCDWFVGSGHKMCGPTGIGFLYGKMEVLKAMPPFLGGGEMIQDVYLDHSTYAEPPNRFEAGTPAIGEAIGLGAACDYLMGIGMGKIHDYEVELSGYLYKKMAELEGMKIYGPKPTDPGGRAALCAFNVPQIHPTDLSMVLDQSGFAIRSGHHCAQPLHRHFGINASARASLYFYNTKEEIDMFIEGLKEAIEFFSVAGGV